MLRQSFTALCVIAVTCLFSADTASAQRNFSFGKKTFNNVRSQARNVASKTQSARRSVSSTVKSSSRGIQNSVKLPTSRVKLPNRNVKLPGKNITMPKPNVRLPKPNVKLPTPNIGGRNPINVKKPGFKLPQPRPFPKPITRPITKPIVKPFPKPIVKPLPKPILKPIGKPLPRPIVKPLPRPIVFPKPGIKPQPIPRPIIPPNPGITPLPRPRPIVIWQPPRRCGWWRDLCVPIRSCRPADVVHCDWNYVRSDAVVQGQVIENARWFLGVEGIVLPGKGLGIEAVEPNSPADQVGLKAGMVITEANGVALESNEIMSEVIAASNGVLEVTVMVEGSDEPLTGTIEMTRLVSSKF